MFFIGYISLIISLLYIFFVGPKNTIDIYNDILFSNKSSEIKSLFLSDEFADRFTEQDYHKLKKIMENTKRVQQFSVFHFGDNDILFIETTPSTIKGRIYIRNIGSIPEHLEQLLSDEVFIEVNE